MNKKILISENERSRILDLHENRRMKEWGLINEEMIYIKDANGKASMFNGSIPPIGSTKIDKVEFDAINKLLGTAAAPVTPAPAPVTPAPAPFIPNGYDSIDACKADYNTSFLSGISMKVFKQNYKVIQKKWIESKCNGKLPCDKLGPSNKNLSMAICEGTFNVSGPVVTPPASNASTVTPPASNASTVTPPASNASTVTPPASNASTVTPPASNASTVTEPMKALTPTSVSSTATQLGLNGATGESPQLATGPMRSGQEIRQDYRQQQQDFRKQNRLSNQNRRQLERELKQLQNDLRSNLANRMSDKDKTDRTNRITQIQTELAQA
jgi:hypothetical protein